MTLAFVLGGATCVYSDYANAHALAEPDIIIAINDIAVSWPHIDYIASYHAELIAMWLRKRRSNKLPDPKGVFTYKHGHTRDIDIPFTLLASKGGSSGMLATEAALTVARKVVLCGVPLDPNMKNIARPDKPNWSAASMYREQWKVSKSKLIGRVKSMSGWTQELLGHPTVEWLNETRA